MALKAAKPLCVSGIRYIGGIVLLRRPLAFQRIEIVPDFCVIAAQEFVCSGCHVDVIGFPFGTFPVQKLVDRFRLRRLLDMYAHDAEQRFPEIWRTALGGFVAAPVHRP